MLLSRILQFRDQSSRRFKTLADFVLNNIQSIYTMSLEDLSSSARVSISTVIRFVKELGYPGFSEFKAALFDELRVHNKTNQWLNHLQHVDTADLSEYMIKQETQKLQQIKDFVASDEFQEAQHWLSDAQNVFILGQQASSPMAGCLAYELGKVRKRVHLINQFRETTYQLIENADSHDAAVVFGFPRYPRNVYQAALRLRQNACHTIVFVHSNDSIFSKIADTTIKVDLHYYGFTTGYTPVMALINLLVLAFCQKNQKSAGSQIENFENSMAQQEVFLY